MACVFFVQYVLFLNKHVVCYKGTFNVALNYLILMGNETHIYKHKLADLAGKTTDDVCGH